MNDLVGQIVGMWTVTKDMGVYHCHRSYMCKCNTCGREREIRADTLVRRKPKCECLFVDAPKHNYTFIARGIHDYLAQNPDSTMKEVCKAMEAFGYSYEEVRRTMFRERGKKIHTTGMNKDGKNMWRAN